MKWTTADESSPPLRNAANLVDGGRAVGAQITTEVHVPPRLDAHAGGIGRQEVSRRELRDLAPDGARPRYVVQRQERVERRRVERALHAGHGQERLDLRAEDQAAILLCVVERLDAQPITDQPQPSLAPVPHREREHAVETRQRGRPPLLPRVRDHLRVGARHEHVPTRQQVAADVVEVVDLAVVADLEAAVLGADGLAPRVGDVDDAEASVGEAEPRLSQESVGVGSAVAQPVRHGAEPCLLHRTAVLAVDPRNSAHARRHRTRATVRWWGRTPHRHHTRNTQGSGI
jgi:hypothetical protein